MSICKASFVYLRGRVDEKNNFGNDGDWFDRGDGKYQLGTLTERVLRILKILILGMQNSHA